MQPTPCETPIPPRSVPAQPLYETQCSNDFNRR
jgi:hypothetical protein